MIKCLIVDDEELARALIESYIKETDFLELIASVSSPLEAIEIIENQDVDLVFLDIQMPEMSGTRLAKVIKSDTKVIFTTAYSEYAIEGFELNALDYLLKPITDERFLMAIDKAIAYFKVNFEGEETIVVKSGYDLHKLALKDIIFIQASSEYVEYQLENKKILSYQALKSLENKLSKNQFMRVHRSYIVNISHIKSLKGRTLLLENYQIPVSETYFEKVKSIFS